MGNEVDDDHHRGIITKYNSIYTSFRKKVQSIDIMYTSWTNAIAENGLESSRALTVELEGLLHDTEEVYEKLDELLDILQETPKSWPALIRRYDPSFSDYDDSDSVSQRVRELAEEQHKALFAHYDGLVLSCYLHTFTVPKEQTLVEFHA